MRSVSAGRMTTTSLRLLHSESNRLVSLTTDTGHVDEEGLMAVTGPVPWDREEHTAAKHDIYSRYLRRWFPIILSTDSWNHATYADGFAGPGIYTGGEEGSPIIAIRAFVDKVTNPRKTASFLFIDDESRCIEMLPKELQRAFPVRPLPPENLGVHITQGTCEEKLETELDRIGAWGSPIIAVLDSWGNAPVSYEFLKRIASNKGSEVIITFKPHHFVRFVDSLGDEADQVFGGDRTWREASAMESSNKRQFILSCYRRALKLAGFEYLLDFELVDRRGDVLYILFATNHPLGVAKMKDSLWEVDRAFGVGFRDPRDDQLQTLFELDDPQLAPLARLLLARLNQLGGRARVDDLRTYTLLNTVFRAEHVISTIKNLMDSGAVRHENGGRNVRRSSYVHAL